MIADAPRCRCQGEKRSVLRPLDAAEVLGVIDEAASTLWLRFSDDGGNYRFSGLDPNADYEIHAEKDGAKSPTRSISSFDNKKDLVLKLKIDKKKS